MSPVTTNPILTLEESSDTILFSETDFPIIRKFTLDLKSAKIFRRTTGQRVRVVGIVVNDMDSIDVVVSESFAVGTRLELQKLDFARQAQPFNRVPAKSSIDLMTLDYAHLGRPFVSYARG